MCLLGFDPYHIIEIVWGSFFLFALRAIFVYLVWRFHFYSSYDRRFGSRLTSCLAWGQPATEQSPTCLQANQLVILELHASVLFTAESCQIGWKNWKEYWKMSFKDWTFTFNSQKKRQLHQSWLFWSETFFLLMSTYIWPWY